MKRVMQRSSQRPLWLSVDEINNLLRCYGIYPVRTLVGRTEEEAVHIASRIGFPVVVKLHSPTIIHKTDVGGVVLDVRSPDQVKKAYDDIKARLDAIGRGGEMDGVVVQRSVPGGVECIVGVTQDVTFGPLILFGLGGIYAELCKNVAMRLHPLTDLDARELIDALSRGKDVERISGLTARRPGGAGRNAAASFRAGGG